jgi:hypothetical protein
MTMTITDRTIVDRLKVLSMAATKEPPSAPAELRDLSEQTLQRKFCSENGIPESELANLTQVARNPDGYTFIYHVDCDGKTVRAKFYTGKDFKPYMVNVFRCEPNTIIPLDGWVVNMDAFHYGSSLVPSTFKKVFEWLI